ncbi:MAG: ImmA/IrrE family metallo-endopeptidase [Pseudomonadota bacterium]
MAIMKDDLDLKLRIAENEAAKIIEKYGISMAEHIRLKDIAYDLRVVVLEGALGGAAASLVRVGKNATIRISTSGSYERKRFSIAHELGHFVLNHGDSVQRFCSEEDMHRGCQVFS